MFCTSFERVLRTLRSMASGACCALSFDEAIHYGAAQSQRIGMDALVSFQNDPKF